MKKNRTLRRVGLVAGTSLLVLAAIGPAASPALAKPSGAIQTTGDSCANPAPQNDNSYLAGETVYGRGTNFAASTAFTWTITGKPGGASGDPNQDVTTGSDTTDAAGAFCVATYVIAADDWGVYSVRVEQGATSKNDNYKVEQAATEAPGDDDTTPPTDDTTPPTDDTTPPTDDGSYNQDVLGVVSGGQAVTPPPTDTVVAPSDQRSGIDWRMIVAFLGVVVLAATIGLPERRRAR